MIITLQEMAEVTETIREQGDQVDEEAPVSTAQRQALAQRKRAEARIEAGQAEVERLEVQVAELREQVEATPRVAEQLEALTRRHRNLTENLRDYNNRRLEAEVQANLERRQLGEQFRVIEPAFPPTTPTSPNRLVIIVTALMAGVSLGVAAAVVAETADSTVHGPQDLQRELGIPVLAAIPTIMLPPDIAARRRRFVRWVAAAGAVVFLSLAGGAVTYMVVNGGLFSGGGEQPELEEPEDNPALRLLREPGRRGPRSDRDDEGA